MSQRIRYSQDQWIALVQAIEDDGGFQSEDDLGHPEVCNTRTYSFIGSHKLQPHERVLEGCGNESIFEIPYDPHEPVSLELHAREFIGDFKYDENGDPVMVTIEHTGEAGAPAVAHSIMVCAVCDVIGWWPRYADVMEDN